jgi:hypothetical protein
MSDLSCSIKQAKKEDWKKDLFPNVVQKSTPDQEINEFTRKLPATHPQTIAVSTLFTLSIRTNNPYSIIPML